MGVQDRPAMRAFDRSLGWRETKNSTAGFGSFLLDGAILALFPFKELAEDARVPASDVGTAFRGVTLAINVETKELVDATIDDLRAKGAMITTEPEDACWGGRSADVGDPEGPRLGGRADGRSSRGPRSEGNHDSIRTTTLNRRIAHVARSSVSSTTSAASNRWPPSMRTPTRGASGL